MNEGPRIIHTEKIPMASVNQVIGTANIAKGLIKARSAIGRYVAVEEVGRVIKKSLLSINVNIEVFSRPYGVQIENR